MHRLASRSSSPVCAGESARGPSGHWTLVLLRIVVMACALAVGTVLVRNGTDVLRGMVHGTPPATALAQPTR